MLKEYLTIQEIAGPLILVDEVEGVKYEELVEIELPDGQVRSGKVLEVNREKALVEVFGGTTGIDINNTRLKFLGRRMELAVSLDMLGRIFDGLGNPVGIRFHCDFVGNGVDDSNHDSDYSGLPTEPMTIDFGGGTVDFGTGEIQF